MLTVTPSWACWSYCPISRSTLFFLCTLWQYPFILSILLSIAAILVVAAVVLILCLPITGVIVLTSVMLKRYSGHHKSTLLFPGYAFAMSISGILITIVQLTWVIFALCWMLSMYLLKLTGFNVNIEGVCGDGDRAMEVWFFPTVFIVSVAVPALEAIGIDIA